MSLRQDNTLFEISPSPRPVRVSTIGPIPPIKGWPYESWTAPRPAQGPRSAKAKLVLDGSNVATARVDRVG